MISLAQGAKVCEKSGNLISLSISFQLHSQARSHRGKKYAISWEKLSHF